ncbi:hypothetical protein L7F22_042946 [Adiantum nelumboides]|nr:hypothetical protein [Adiantum nelumboides]
METHIHVELRPMPEMLDLPGTSHQEEEEQRRAPRALDVRAKLTQSIKDMPEGPAKEFMLYEIKSKYSLDHLQELACGMACSPLRVGSDAVGQCSVALGGHLRRHQKMKQVLSRSSLWHVLCRGPSCIRYGRNLGSQAVAVEEMEASESGGNKFRRWQADETKILIAAKNQYDRAKLEIKETAGIHLNIKNNWKEIESLCKQRGLQRSAEQCKTRWSRLMLTYVQIKLWERNKEPGLLSYWSMKMDERKAAGFLLYRLDQSAYKLLDVLYSSRVDSVKDGSIEDTVELPESGSVEGMLPGQGFQPSQKEKSEFGRIANANQLSISDKDFGTHRKRSQLFSMEVNVSNEKQVEGVAGATTSVEEPDRANSCSSTLGLAASHELQNEKLDGAAASLEIVLQDQRHNGQVAAIADPPTQTCEVLGASVASTETNATDEQRSEEVSCTTACVSITDECRSTDRNGALKSNLEAGDTTNANILSAHTEGGLEKQRGLVADIEALLEEAHQCKNKETASTGAEIFSAMQVEQISEDSFSTPAAVNTTFTVGGRRSEGIDSLPYKFQDNVTSPESRTTQSSRVILAEQVQYSIDDGFLNQEINYTGSEVFKIMPNEQASGSEVSKNNPGTVNTIGSRIPEDSHSLPYHERQMVDLLPEEESKHSLKYTIFGQPCGDDVGSLNQEPEYHGAAVQSKGTTLSAEQCSLSQPVHNVNDELSFIKEDDGCTDMVDKGATTSNESTSGMGFGESCEGKGAEALERPATDRDVKEIVTERGLQLHDSRKYDNDILMYVPAAIGNVIRSVSQTFRKFFKD